MQKHPELQDLRTEVEEELLDVAEFYIVQAIRAGDMKVIRWYLERKAKERGYSLRLEQTGADGGPLEFGAIERRIVDAVGKVGQVE
jgi:hypothetical protein